MSEIDLRLLIKRNDIDKIGHDKKSVFIKKFKQQEGKWMLG